VSAAAGDAVLDEYLSRPMTPPAEEVTRALERGPVDPADTLPLAELERLLDPAPLAVETGWCTLPDGIGFVAVRTPMAGVSAEMVEWWFDWHPGDPLRYRIWHPVAHFDNSVERPAVAGAKPHWGAVHHPVEDVGTGTVRARIAFLPPSGLGFASDALDDPRVGTIVCGLVGDDSRRVRHSAMAHVFLAEGDGLVLRSHFWLGAKIPFGNRVVRRLGMPSGLPRALAGHCAEEYANLATLLPELYRRFA
jgi:hypothetical protein